MTPPWLYDISGVGDNLDWSSHPLVLRQTHQQYGITIIALRDTSIIDSLAHLPYVQFHKLEISTMDHKITLVPHNWCVCFNKIHVSFNFKSKVSRYVFKKLMNVNRHVHFLLKYHLNITCPIPCLISHFLQFLTCQLTCGFFLHKSDYMSYSKLWGSIDMHIFVCKFLHVKCQKLCQKFTLLTMSCFLVNHQ